MSPSNGHHSSISWMLESIREGLGMALGNGNATKIATEGQRESLMDPHSIAGADAFGNLLHFPKPNEINDILTAQESHGTDIGVSWH